MKRVLLSVILSGALGASVWGQTSSITGTVLEEGLESAVVGAHIFIEELKQGTVSNAKGQFTIVDLPAGSYNLVISNVGFENNRIAITLNEGE